MSNTHEVCVKYDEGGLFCGVTIGQYYSHVQKNENAVRIISVKVSRFENDNRSIARVIESAMTQVIEALEDFAHRNGKTEALETLRCIIHRNQKGGDLLDKKNQFAAIWFEVEPHHRVSLFHALVRRISRLKSGWSEYLPPTSHVYSEDIDAEEGIPHRCQSRVLCTKKAEKKITCGTVSQMSCFDCRYKVAEIVVDEWSAMKQSRQQYPSTHPPAHASFS